MFSHSIPYRYVLTFLGFIGFVFNYTLRVNINLIITAMANDTSADGSTGNANDFNWDSSIKSDVIGSFFYGYMVFQMPGGRVAEMFGGKRVIGLAMGGTALLTLLIPVAADYGGRDGYPYALVAVRVLMGLFEGVTFPAVSSMMSRWAPISERAIMSTLIMAGSQVGTITGFYLSGVLVDTWGWRTTFYIEGGACFIWLLLWLLLVFDTPESHPWISQAEKDLILDGCPAKSKVSPPIPWRSMLVSLPVWAIIAANFANNWGFHLLMTELPSYLQKVFPDDMDDSSTIGMWTAIPYGIMWLFSLACSTSADMLIKRKLLSIATVRKIFNSIAHAGASVMLLALLLSATDATDKETKDKELVITLSLFTTGVALMGALYAAWITNPQDICPNFAGTVLGITNCIGSIPGFVAPKVASVFIEDHESQPSYWQPVWIITVSIMLVETVFYIIFAGGTPQPWNTPNHEASKNHQEEGKVP